MAFDPNQPGAPEIPTPNINPQPQTAAPSEQEIRTMRADLGGAAAGGGQAVSGLPTFDAEEPTFTPETTNQMPGVMQTPGTSGKKMPWLLIGGILGFVVLALVGYFVVYPMFMTPDPVAVTPEPTPTPTAPTMIHKTAFINAPVATVTQILNAGADGSVSGAEVKGAFVSKGQTAPTPGITEIVFTDATGTPIPFGKILVAVGGDFAAGMTATIANEFTNDGTFFIYKDENGVWPGYIGEATATSPELLATTTWLEGSTMLANLFVVDPGALAAWKSGTINTLPDRYSAGKTAGASLGYLVTKNKMLISTSFNGMKEALRLMGL